MPFKDKEKERKWKKQYYIKNSSELYDKQKLYLEKNPWQRCLCGIRARCSSLKHHYFRNGIKNMLNNEQIKFLWFRDNAFLMMKPSIDRIDTYGNYTIDNCRFIELNDNLKRSKAKCHRTI
jgi:hypothetical protein